MNKQLEFSFDSDEIVESNKYDSLYDYCIANNRLDLLDEWDNELNEITPKDILYSSTTKCHWKCKKDGYKFILSPNARTNFYNSGCPLCANKVVIKGVNDLESNYPNISKMWDNMKNGDKKPFMYSYNSEEVFCFICSKKHSFESSIKKLVKNKGICPICAKKKIFKGYNDIFTLYPVIKKEWDNKNNKVDPYTLKKTSRKKIYLICSNNHSYETTIKNRLENKIICPYCTNKKAIEGVNDIKTLYPNIAKTYSTSNKELITTLTEESTKRVLWICPNCNNTYRMSVKNRIKKNKCPLCKKA